MKVQLVEKREHDGKWYYLKVNSTCIKATRDYVEAKSAFNFYVENKQDSLETVLIECEVKDEELQTV